MNTVSELTLKYIPLVHSIVRKMTINFPPQVERDDLVSSGFIGLIDAIDKYDPEKGVKFATYAKTRIRGSILDELRSIDWAPQSVRRNAKKIYLAVCELKYKLDRPAEDEEIANHLGFTLEDFYKMLNSIRIIPLVATELLEYQNGSEDTPLSLYQLKEKKENLFEMLERLPKKHKMIIMLHYFDDYSMREISVILGVSGGRVSQIHMAAIRKLRKIMENN